jgi:AAA+ ATPase superfamily predicted ATPase
MFVGREQELAKLRAFFDRGRSGISVIYGRRRIGKTRLIAEALQQRRSFFFDGLENRPQTEHQASDGPV